MKNDSEFSNVTLASADDNDNTDVIVLKKLDKFSKGEDLHDALQFNMSRRMAMSFPMLLFLPMMLKDNSDLNECDQEVDKTPIEDYGQDVIFNRSLVNFLITFN